MTEKIPIQTETDYLSETPKPSKVELEKVHVLQSRRQLPPVCNNDLPGQTGRRLPKWLTKPHTCSECGCSFDRPSKLNVHFRIHTGVQPYGCGICGKLFNQKNNLKAHMLRKHRDQFLS